MDVCLNVRDVDPRSHSVGHSAVVRGRRRSSREAARAELSKAIGDRYILLVLDDVWRKADADLFLTGAKNSAVLITTRLDAQLPDETSFKQTVDAMRLEQAVELLAARAAKGPAKKGGFKRGGGGAAKKPAAKKAKG